MKKIVSIIIIGLILTSCQKENRTDFVINGKAKDVYNGIRVYLNKVDQKGNQIVVDTAVVMNETFKMKGSIDEPTIHFLSVDGALGAAILMLENSNIDIEINKEKLIESKVKGSKTNEWLNNYQKGINEINQEGNAIMLAYRTALNSSDAIKKDSLSKKVKEIGARLKEYPINFITDHNDNYFSLNLIGLETNKPKNQYDISGFVEAFNNLNSELKTSKIGKEIKVKLDGLYEEYKKTANVEVGKIAPNFEAPTPDGHTINLDDIKGKVTIIDFWAAWCGPCRRENPNVVRVYDRYHDKGLEIIGVSLDGDRRQQDPKKAWLNAIEKDELTWNHVSHLKYFDDPVAKLYNIQSIPATFILDEEGKIVAKNLRGKALENKVKELLENE